MDYGKLLREKREEVNMSIKELAASAGVSERAIYFWERGDRQMSLNCADRLLKALGVSVTIGAVAE